MTQLEPGQAMKEGMRRLASGVSVVASRNAEGEPCAMTATSVTSVSDNPASLLVCVNKDTQTYKILTSSPEAPLSVNLLAHEQDDISNRCASGDPGPSRFDIGAWDLDAAAPILKSGLASFVCRTDQIIDYGTHGIVIAVIEDVLINDRNIDPLLYLNGGYCQAK